MFLNQAVAWSGDIHCIDDLVRLSFDFDRESRELLGLPLLYLDGQGYTLLVVDVALDPHGALLVLVDVFVVIVV